MLEEYKKEQPIAYKILSKIIRENNFSHAYLIETNGYDKGISLAYSFAKAILCPSGKEKNCENCNQCNLIDENNFPELKVISPDGSLIKKEQLLELQDEFSKKSIIGSRKVYILNKADRLNLNSSNSILKFLEEPQEGITAILITDNQYQLIDTIISRCQIISLNGCTDINKYSDTFSKIGQLLTINEEEFNEYQTNEKNINLIENIIKFSNLYENSHKKTILYMNQYWFSNFNDKIEMGKAINVLLYYYKDILNQKLGQTIEYFNDYVIDINKTILLNSVESLINKVNAINKCRQNIEYNANLNLLMDKLVIDMEGE